jgi:hypothetical protein
MCGALFGSRLCNSCTTVTVASSNNALPDDGDCTETCRSCFNVNFNVNFNIVFFKTTRLCIGWWINKTSRINFHFELEVPKFSYALSVWELYPFRETAHLRSQKYPLNMPCDPRSIRFVNEAAILARIVIDNENEISFVMRTHTSRTVY